VLSKVGATSGSRDWSRCLLVGLSRSDLLLRTYAPLDGYRLFVVRGRNSEGTPANRRWLCRAVEEFHCDKIPPEANPPRYSCINAFAQTALRQFRRKNRMGRDVCPPPDFLYLYVPIVRLGISEAISNRTSNFYRLRSQNFLDAPPHHFGCSPDEFPLGLDPFLTAT
jgi:hypothetical protein